MPYDPESVLKSLSDGQVADLPMFGGSHAAAPLFPAHTRARLTDPPTSHQAAAAVDAAGQRAAILQALAGGAMTADEIDAALGWRVTTAGRRLGELYRLGRARTTGATRPTRSGRAAEVWEAV